MSDTIDLTADSPPPIKREREAQPPPALAREAPQGLVRPAPLHLPPAPQHLPPAPPHPPAAPPPPPPTQPPLAQPPPTNQAPKPCFSMGLMIQRSVSEGGEPKDKKKLQKLLIRARIPIKDAGKSSNGEKVGAKSDGAGSKVRANPEGAGTKGEKAAPKAVGAAQKPPDDYHTESDSQPVDTDPDESDQEPQYANTPNWNKKQLEELEAELGSRLRGGRPFTDQQLADLVNGLGGGRRATKEDVEEWMTDKTSTYQADMANGRAVGGSSKSHQEPKKPEKVEWEPNQIVELRAELMARMGGGTVNTDKKLAEIVSGLRGRKVTEEDVAEWMRVMTPIYQADKAAGLAVGGYGVPSWAWGGSGGAEGGAAGGAAQGGGGKPAKRRRSKQSMEASEKKPRQYYGQKQRAILEIEFLERKHKPGHVPDDFKAAESVSGLDGAREVDEEHVRRWMKSREKRGTPYMDFSSKQVKVLEEQFKLWGTGTMMEADEIAACICEDSTKDRRDVSRWDVEAWMLGRKYEEPV